MSFSLAGCGGKKKSKDTSSDEPVAESPTVSSGGQPDGSPDLDGVTDGSVILDPEAPATDPSADQPQHADPAHSTVTLSAPTVASGNHVTATLTAKNADGELVTTGGDEITFALQGGASTATLASTIDHNDGTYSIVLTGVLAGTPTNVTAMINNVAVTTTFPTLAVTPGLLSPATSVVSLLSSTIGSGTTTTVALDAKDAAGNALTSGGQTVHFAITNGVATIGSTTDAGTGHYAAAVTAGSGTISATVNGLSVTTTMPTLQVLPGNVSLSQSQVQVSAGSLASGGTITAKVRVRDAASNLLTSGGLTIAFSTSGGASTGSFGPVTDNHDGTYTSTFTGILAGAATQVRATINGGAVTSTLPTVTVAPGALSLAGSLVALQSVTIGSGATTTVSLDAKDAAGNSLPNGGATVNFAITNGVATIGSTTDDGNGHYSATITATTSGTGTISATVNGLSVTSSMPTLQVLAGSISLANSQVEVNTSTLASGSTITAKVTARDSSANVLTSGGLTVAFTLSGGSSTGSFNAVTDNHDGTYTATFTGILAGTAATVNATINGGQITSTLPTVTVNPGSASLTASTVSAAVSSIASGSTVVLTVVAKDAAGNQLNAGGLTVGFSAVGGTSTGSIGSVTDNADGTYSATFTGNVAGSATTIHATIGGSQITSTLPTIAVVPSSYSVSTSQVSVSAASLGSGADVTLTLTAKDAANNQLTTGGLTVAFTHAGGSSTGSISAVTDNGDGTYSATFTGSVAGSATTMHATINGGNVTSTMPTLTVTASSFSASTSTVSASTTSVASGSTVTLTVTAKDAASNQLPTGGLTVAFSNVGGASTGSFSAVTDNNDGTYSATFTGTLAGSATTIHASLNGSDITSTRPTVTVTPSTASMSTSLVSRSAATVASGSTVTVSVTAKDAAGNSLTSGGLTVAFSNAGGTSTGSFSAVTDNNNGTYSATFTGNLAGTATTINATINGSAITSTLPALQVLPGAASYANSLVEVSAASVASGASVVARVTVRDAALNVLTAGGQTIAFSRTGGTSTGSFGAVTDNADGTYTANFTGLVAGTATTIRATIGGTSITSTLPTVTVNPAAFSAATSTVTASASTVVSGSTVTMTATAKDANGNQMSSGGLAVVFSNVGGATTGTFGSVIDNGNGTYSATFTGALAGTATTIHASLNGSDIATTLPTVAVTPGAFNVANSVVTRSAATVASASSINVTAIAKDSAGNQLSAGGLTVAFSNAGGASTGSFSAVTDNNNGTYSATFTGNVAGASTTIQATINATAITSTLPTVQVLPGAVSYANSLVEVSASSIASGNSVVARVTVRDAASNILTAGGQTIAFSRTGGTSTGTFGSVTDNADGTYTANFSALVAGTATTIRGTINGTLITSTLPTVTVIPAAFSAATSMISASASTVVSSSSVTVTATAKDVNNNQMTTGGLAVVFSIVGGTATGSFGSVSDNGNGTYTATFTGVVAGTATTIHASLNGTDITTTLPTIVVTPGAFNVATSVVARSAATVASASSINVTVTARDTNGNQVAGGGLTVVFSNTGGASTGSFSATTDNGNGTYAATFTGITAGTATTIRASINGTQISSTLPTVQVLPGAISYSASLVEVTAATVTSGSAITAKVTVRDAANNVLTAGGQTIAFSRTGGASSGTFGSVTDNADGTYTATFSATTAGSATTIRGTINGTLITSTLPTVTVNASTFSVANSTVSAVASTVVSGSTVVLTVTAKDSNNNQLPTGGLTVAFSNVGGAATGTYSAVTDNNNGTYTATFTGVLAGTATAIHGSINGSDITTTLPSIAVTPSTANVATSTVSRSAATVASGTNVTVTVTTKDAAGNQLTSGGLAVVFSNTGGTSTGTFSGTTDNGNGTYTANFTGSVAGTATMIRATIAGTLITSTLPTIQVLPGAISYSASLVEVSASTVASGSGIIAKVTARDAANNVLTAGGQTIAFSRTGGTSSGSFGSVTDNANGTYTSTFTGTTAGTATTIRGTINGTLITSTLPTVTVGVGAVSLANSTITASAGTVVSGSTVTLTVTARDASNNQLPAGGLTVAFSNSGGTATGSIGSVTDNANGTYTATFTGTLKGTATSIGATIGGSNVTSTSPTIAVTQGPLSLATSLVSVSASSVASGSTINLTLTAKDAAGNAFATGGLTGVTFNLSGGTSTGSIDTSTDNGNGTYTSTFTGDVAGTAAQVLAKIAGSNVTSTAPTVSVTPGLFDADVSTLATSATSIASGSSATITLTAKDASGNQLTSGGATVVFSSDNGTSTGNFGTVTDNNNGTYTATYTGVIAGTANDITATYNATALTYPPLSIGVTVGSPSMSLSTVTVDDNTVPSAENANVTLTVVDAAGNQMPTGGLTVVFSFTGGASTGTFTTVVDNGNGTYTSVFTGAVAGSASTVRATIGGSTVTSTLPAITVLPSATIKYTVSGYPASATAGTSSAITLVVSDTYGNPITDYVGTVVFTSDDMGATLPADYQFTLGDAGSKTFNVTLVTNGTHAIVAKEFGNPTVTGSQTGIVISVGAAVKLGFSGAQSAKANACSALIDLKVADNYNNAVSVGNPVDVTLGGQGSGVFYDDDACTHAILAATIPSGSSGIALYFRDAIAEGLTLSATDQASALTTGTLAFNVKASQAWFGSSALAQWFAAGGKSVKGRLDYEFNGPIGFTIDSNNMAYVVDSANFRVMKFDNSDGTYIGWIGTISDAPTGGASGCAGLASGQTPGWCTGGFAKTGTATGGFNAPYGIAADGSNLFVVDQTNHRIQRFNSTTGAATGWIGKIATVPTGGASGCTTAAVGTFTPGWCTGGTSATGTGDGMLNSPKGIHFDGTYLYVVDSSNFRISRYAASTGAFAGWIGNISSVPTGGAAGCSTAAVSTFTPGWCTGGTAKTGTGNGMMSSARGIAGDATSIYVADVSNARIQRFTMSTGAFTGWIGNVSTVATGGASGCTSTPVSSATPGWCTGGTAKTGTGNGQYSSPYAVAIDSTYLYVADLSNQRIQRLTLAGAFSAWVGRVLTVPTAGVAGCTTTAINSATPGWCSGGTAAAGADDGMLNNPFNLFATSTAVYVTDNANHRVVRYDSATGVASGWTGSRAKGTSVWSIANETVHISGLGDASFNNPYGIFEQSGNLYVMDASNHRIKRYTTANGSFNGWTGNVYTPPTGGAAGCSTTAVSVMTPGWCTGGNSKTGTGNGMMNTPQGVWSDGSYIYVVDTSNGRVNRYTTAGVSSGWIGKILTSPTGGAAGCSGATVGTMTPGWCTGGTATSGTGDGMMTSATGIYGDGTYLYVSDAFRINRYVAATGASSGWIGNISTATTGGAAGCSTAPVSTFTPGWCTGGTAKTGTGNGMLNGPRGLFVAGTYLYVVDAGNFRVVRYTMSSGAFGGWIGNISTTPTGGAANCSTAAVSTFTPGWCTGGTAKTGTGNGMMNAPKGLWGNGTNLYVVDSTNNRINKYVTSTGASVGWSGNINTSPTGGDAGCAGAAVGTLTPGWCTGGTAKRGDKLGMFDVPAWITGDSTYLYVTDITNDRVTRLPQ